MEAMPIQYMDPAPEPEAGSNTCPEPMQLAIQQDMDDPEGEYDEDMHVEELADSELLQDDMDDVSCKKGPTTHAYVPASFFDRPVYCMLKDEGLTALPFSEGEGFALRCHKQSQQWHAVWEAKKRNFAPTWGNKRSELMSLLTALRQLWIWYLVSVDYQDALGKEQLERIRERIKTVKF